MPAGIFDNRRPLFLRPLPMSEPSRLFLVDRIEALLPQTQCGKCGTPGCRPYAEAVAAGTPFNRCVPGGADTIAELAALLQQAPLPLDPAFGVEPLTQRVAFIREDECIGCTKCLQACPVDAILGAGKLMHTVIIEECSGCDLCLPACPVDCIDMHDLPKIVERNEKQARANHYRARFEARNARLARGNALQQAPTPTAVATAAVPAADDKALVIAAALARTKLKKAERRLAAMMEGNPDFAALQTEIATLKQEVVQLEARQREAMP